MSTRRRGISIILSLLASVPAFGQFVTTAAGEEAAIEPCQVSPSGVLAGVRGYSGRVVEALVLAASHPAALQQAAEDLWADQQPEIDAADMSPELREALELLTRSPELLLLAATHPDELELLRSMWSYAPEGVIPRKQDCGDSQ